MLHIFYSHLIKVFLLNLVFSLNKCHLAESFFRCFRISYRSEISLGPPPHLLNGLRIWQNILLHRVHVGQAILVETLDPHLNK